MFSSNPLTIFIQQAHQSSTVTRNSSGPRTLLLSLQAEANSSASPQRRFEKLLELHKHRPRANVS